jgi:hypothetical protein
MADDIEKTIEAALQDALDILKIGDIEPDSAKVERMRAALRARMINHTRKTEVSEAKRTASRLRANKKQRKKG